VEQGISVLKQAEVGVPAAELIRKVRIPEQTLDAAMPQDELSSLFITFPGIPIRWEEIEALPPPPKHCTAEGDAELL